MSLISFEATSKLTTLEKKENLGLPVTLIQPNRLLGNWQCYGKPDRSSKVVLWLEEMPNYMWDYS